MLPPFETRPVTMQDSLPDSALLNQIKFNQNIGSRVDVNTNVKVTLQVINLPVLLYKPATCKAGVITLNR